MLVILSCLKVVSLCSTMTYTVDTRTVKHCHFKCFHVHACGSAMLDIIFIIPMTTSEDSKVGDFYLNKLAKYADRMAKLPMAFEIANGLRYKSKIYVESKAKFSAEIKTFDKHCGGRVRLTERLSIRHYIPESCNDHEIDYNMDVRFNND